MGRWLHAIVDLRVNTYTYICKYIHIHIHIHIHIEAIQVLHNSNKWYSCYLFCSGHLWWLVYQIRPHNWQFWQFKGTQSTFLVVKPEWSGRTWSILCLLIHRCPARPGCLMMTSSNGNFFRVTGPLCGEFTGPGEFPTQRPVTRSFDAFFDLRLNKRLSKQPWGWWFDTSSWSLWRHCNVLSWYGLRRKHDSLSSTRKVLWHRWYMVESVV